MLKILLSIVSIGVGATLAHADQKALPTNNAAAEKPKEAAAYIRLKPNDGIYDVVVMGDSLANGLHQGLTQFEQRQFASKNHTKVKSEYRIGAG